MSVADYLEDTVRVWLGLRPDTAAPTMPDDLARLFLRSEELETDERDRWGCFDFAAADNARRGALGVAEVDRWLADVLREAAMLGKRAALDPGAFVKRGAAELAGEPFTERMDQWQNRAVDAALAALTTPTEPTAEREGER